MKMRELSLEEERLLSNFVTDIYGPVYFIHSLPEFIIPPINSKVSRRDTSWRLNILESLSDGDLNINDFVRTASIPLEGAIQKAKAFHEKWVEKFGHSSIAEQHLMHLCVEDISRHLSGDIELMNKRPAFIEWSQRYQKPTRDKVVIPPELNEYPELKDKFLKVWNISYDSYEELVELLIDYLSKSSKRKENENEEKFYNRISKIAYEDARYALLLATRTSFAVALNSLDLEDIVRKLLVHNSEEARLLAARIKEQAEKIAPSMLRHTKPSEYQMNVNKRLKDITKTIISEKNEIEDVILIDYTGKDGKYSPDDILLMHILFTYSGKSFEAVQKTIDMMSEDEKLKIIEEAVKDIGEFDHLIEPFKSIRFKFQLCISEANWHQLLRHRTILFDASFPSIDNGYVVPPNIKKAGGTGILERAVKTSEKFYNELKDKLPSVCPYVVTNAHRRLVLMNTDLWAFDHFANLRCTEHAQWDIRNVSFKMLELIKSVSPRLAGFMARRKNS